MTAALPKEEAPRCPDCGRAPWVAGLFCVGDCLRSLGLSGSAECYRLGYERSTAAHQKTLDALEAALLASRTKLRQQQGVKAAFSGLAASAASILAAGGRNV